MPVCVRRTGRAGAADPAGMLAVKTPIPGRLIARSLAKLSENLEVRNLANRIIEA